MSWNEIRKNVAEVKKNNFSNIQTRLDLNLSKNLLSNYCSLFEIFYELKLRDILFYIIGPLSNNNILAVIVLASLSLEDNEVEEICGKKSINFATSLLNGVSRINLDKVKNLFSKNFTNINDNIDESWTPQQIVKYYHETEKRLKDMMAESLGLPHITDIYKKLIEEEKKEARKALGESNKEYFDLL